jgi:hypothetical protein
MRKVKGLVGAGILIILLSGCTPDPTKVARFETITLGSPSNVAPTQEPTENPDENSPVSDSFAELDIDNQDGSGFEVQVEEVRLSLGKAFLVISSTQGEVYGYAIVTPDSQPVVIELSKKLAFSQKLIAALYLDNGDEVFSLQSDRPLKDEDGDLVEEDFDYFVDED